MIAIQNNIVPQVRVKNSNYTDMSGRIVIERIHGQLKIDS